MMADRDAQSGFVLLEVLAALAIFVAFASAMMGAFSVAVRGDDRALFDTRSVIHARSLLAAAGIERAISLGSSAGRLANGLSWQTDVRLDRTLPVREGRQISGYWVTVTVTDDKSTGRRPVSLTSYEIAESGQGR